MVGVIIVNYRGGGSLVVRRVAGLRYRRGEPAVTVYCMLVRLARCGDEDQGGKLELGGSGVAAAGSHYWEP